MIRRWILPLLLLIVVSGCAMSSQQEQPTPSSTPNMQSQSVQPLSEQATPLLNGGPEIEHRKSDPMTLSQLRAKYPSTFILNAPSAKTEVALTFDDGPDEYFTPQVLDILQKEGVKATFFLVGNRMEAHPDVVQRIIENGHIIGNHSYSHPNYATLKDKQFQKEILKTDKVIQRFTGYKPSFLRPPYGNITEEQIKWLASQHKRVVNWNVDSLDWKQINAAEVSKNILTKVHPGSIILQHSAGGVGQDLQGTVDALSDIIAKIKERGMTFVTIPELLDMPKG
ncbi:polysaccharide deacetylase family protein [Paenibacillus yanchengensis]|uniref:Polysaccharide deacetylase family protein n=1 Tax=Paenibacillus yanchengensis TaxID=2035833 RepID=A0ABW4YFX0_9BACL